MKLNLRLFAEIVNYEFDTKNLVCLLISSVVGVWYLLKKVSLIREPVSRNLSHRAAALQTSLIVLLLCDITALDSQ